MKEKITKILRIVLGTLLLVFGLNKGLNFITLPAPPESSFPFWTGLVASNFIMPTIMVIEVLVGLSLLVNRYTKLTLLLMTPVMYGIIMYHVMFDLSGIVIPLVITLLHAYLIYVNRRSYKNLLS